jgi:hypothetical protein
VTSDDEKFYDDAIAPLLKVVGELCRQRGMDMVAVVEFEPGRRGETRSSARASRRASRCRCCSLCARHGANLDGMVLGLIRWCRANGIDTGGSIVASRLTGG